MLPPLMPKPLKARVRHTALPALRKEPVKRGTPERAMPRVTVLGQTNQGLQVKRQPRRVLPQKDAD